MTADQIEGNGGIELLRVASGSPPNLLAGAIAGVLRDSGRVAVQVVGAGALNQAIKAVAIARSFVAAEGIDPVLVPEFRDIKIDGAERTAILLMVEDRARADAHTAQGVSASRSSSPVNGLVR